MVGFLEIFQKRKGERETGDQLNFLYILIHEVKRDKTIRRCESISKAGITNKDPLLWINMHIHIFIFTSTCTEMRKENETASQLGLCVSHHL